jgi:hypothetical protein
MTTLVTNENCNAIVTTSTGDSVAIFADQLIDKRLNFFNGWSCNAGSERIYIEKDFTVFSGQCKNNMLGNLFDENFKILNHPVICKQNSCTCTGDIYTTKKANI